jgi:hypothetical protein
LGGIEPDARSVGNQKETDGKYDMTIGLNANYRLSDRPFHGEITHCFFNPL